MEEVLKCGWYKCSCLSNRASYRPTYGSSYTYPLWNTVPDTIRLEYSPEKTKSICGCIVGITKCNITINYSKFITTKTIIWCTITIRISKWITTISSTKVKRQ